MKKFIIILLFIVCLPVLALAEIFTQPYAIIKTDGRVLYAEFSPDNKKILLYTVPNGVVKIIDINSLNIEQTYGIKTYFGILGGQAIFSPDQTKIIAKDNGNNLYKWKYEEEVGFGRIYSFDDSVVINCMVFSHDSKYLAVGLKDNHPETTNTVKIIILDTETWETYKSVIIEHPYIDDTSFISSLDYSPKDKKLLIALDSAETMVWNIETETFDAIIGNDAMYAKQAIFMDLGYKTIIATINDLPKKIYLWTMEGEKIGEIANPNVDCSYFNYMDFLGYDRLITHNCYKVYLWKIMDFDNISLINEYHISYEGYSLSPCIKFSPDGEKFLITGDREVQIWNVNKEGEYPKPTPCPLLGDINCDGEVTPYDGLLALQIYLGLYKP